MLGTGLVPNPCGTRSILVTVGGGALKRQRARMNLFVDTEMEIGTVMRDLQVNSCAKLDRYGLDVFACGKQMGRLFY